MERQEFTIEEAIEYSGKSRSTIYRYIYSGKLKAAQDVSKIWRINKADLDELINKRTPNTIENQ